MNKVRFGIVGLGNQGSSYSKILSGNTENVMDNCALGAICDILPAKEKEFKELYPDTPFYTDWKEMILSGNIDAVITTVPHYLHTEIAIFAMDNKIHVLGEKPAGIDAKSVRLMNECSDRNPDVTFGVMFNQRTNKLYQRVKEIVESGELGEFRRMNWISNRWWRPDTYYKSSDWRATWGAEGGGILVNQAPHQLDMWQWITGMPTKIMTKMIYGSHRDILVDNDVSVICEYDNGATGVLVMCTHDVLGTERLELDFSAGKIELDTADTGKIYRFIKSEPELNETMSMEDITKMVGSGKGTDNDLYTLEELNFEPVKSQHSVVMRNFAAHILDGTPMLADGKEGINEVNLVNAIYLSAWLGKEVELPVDEDLFLAELNKKIKEEGKYPERNV